MEKPKRLQKILAESGIASRRKAEVFISEGRIKVNGKTAKIGATVLRSDSITLDGRPIKKRPRFLYYAFHKPAGYVVSAEKQGSDPIIFRLFKTPARVFPVGRLDKESEGLLILTNDGDFAQKISHPRHEKQKVYEVVVDRKIEKSNMHQMEKGILLHDEDGTSYSTQGTEIQFTQSPRKVLVKLLVGKYHVIRKMFGHFGYAVVRLKRTSIGNVSLGRLKNGELRPLTPEEIQGLKG